MKVLVYFIKSYIFFFFTILSLLIDCGEKTWSLQIIHFYFEEDFFFSLLLFYIWVSPIEIKKILGGRKWNYTF